MKPDSHSGKAVPCEPGKVSVIVPNYNHAAYLPDALDSILAQRYPDFEIIVVDDGSTDHSREVIDGYGERVRPIFQENQGLSAARNSGIRVARGEYIALLDADDLYEPDFMRVMAGALAADPAAAAVFCGYRFVDEQNRALPQVEARPVPAELVFPALADGNFLVPESMLVRRGCYEKLGLFDPALTACEDWDMWLRIARSARVISTAAVLTRHRVLPGSMSTDPTRMLTNRLAVLEKHFGQAASGAPADPARGRAYGRAYLGAAVEFLQTGDRPQAGRCLLEMAAACPTLLTELPTFYELALGSQPKGSRGDFASAPAAAEANLLGLLDDLFESNEIADAARIHRQTALARAYEALGRIAYGARRFKEARRLLSRSVAAARGQVSPALIPFWLKSYLPPRWIETVRNFRKLSPGDR